MKKIVFFLIFVVSLLCFISIVNAIGSIPQEISSMNAHYHFNNDSSVGENDTFFYDYSPAHINNGTCTTTGCPKFNTTDGFLSDGAFRFDGINDVITVPDHNSLSIISQPNNGTTFSVWFKINQDENGNGATGQQFIFTKGTGSNYEYNMYRTNTTDGNKVAFQLFSLAGAANTVTLLSGYQFDQWYHAVIQINNTGIQPYIFLPNETMVKGTATAVTQTIGNGTANFMFGKRQDLSAGFFNGSIDEFIMYNYSMTTNEVWDLHQQYIGCWTPYDGFSPRGDTLFCSGTYQTNGSQNGYININNVDNATIYCNGTIFQGNASNNGADGSLGLQNFQRTNITIQNCNITNFHYGIKQNSGMGHIKNNYFINNIYSIQLRTNGMIGNITNNTFINQSSGDIYNLATNQTGNLLIDKNTFYLQQNISGVYQDPSSTMNNIIIDNNTFNKSTVQKATTTLEGSTNWTITNNYVRGSGTGGDTGIEIRGNNYNLNNNIIEYGQYCFSITNAKNTTVYNNTLQNCDEGTQTYNVDNLTITTNNYINNTMDYDGYDLGIKIKHSRNVKIINNNFSEISSTAIMAQNSSNITIQNNSFATIPISSRNNYNAKEYGDPQCAISIVELYKSYFGNGQEPTIDENLTTITKYKSNNITILNNTFNSNTSCLLRTEGTSNITHDLTNYWYNKFRTPIYLKDTMEFWISNNFNNLTAYYGTPGALKLNMMSTFYGQARMEYILKKDSIYFNNTNKTVSYETALFNLTNSLIYYNNGSVVCNDINSCDGNINISLNPGNFSYVLDNFNLSEGVSRANSPLWVVSRSDDGRRMIYHLGSNLTSTLHNVTFVPSAQILCGSVSYLSNSSFYSNTVTTSCVNGFISSFLISGFEPSSSSNVLMIEYSSGASGGGSSSGSNNSFPYNKTVLCNESLGFINKHKNNGVLSYNSSDLEGFRQKMEIIQGLSVPEEVIKPFIDSYEENCGVIEMPSLPSNTGVESTKKSRWWLMPLLLAGGILVVLFIGLLVFDISSFRPKKPLTAKDL